jgi:hypothetical protein
MGHRANLIIVNDGRYDLFYSHGAANTLPRDLFWGPDHATAFIRIQRHIDESGWLDEIWAEGGAILDQDRKCLVIFGGEDIRFDVPLRRVYLELLGKVWASWQVRWANNGVVDLADYVGYPREKVLSDKPEPSWQCTLSPPQNESWTDIVGTVDTSIGVRIFPLAGEVDSYLGCGLQLVEAAKENLGLREFDFAEKNTGFPTGGFHLDLQRKEVHYWIANSEPNLADRLDSSWPGWRIVAHQDRFESQLELAGSALRFPTLSRLAILDRVRDLLMLDVTKSPVDTLLSLTATDLPDVKTVEINPYALRDDRLPISREDKEGILNRALADLDQPLGT